MLDRWFRAFSFIVALLLATSFLTMLRPVTIRAEGESAAAIRADSFDQATLDQPDVDIEMLNADINCEANGLETVWGGFCTHGSDEQAPDVAALVEEPGPLNHEWDLNDLCEGDGDSGKRVQLIYAHASDQSDDYEVNANRLVSLALQSDRLLHESATRMGGNRHVRFVHDDQCVPTILNVTLSPSGDDHLGSTIHELFNLGFNRLDRKYLVFVESYNDCGVASVVPDDQPGPSNDNNRGPNYARVDKPCWDVATTAHELMHALGGVQNSAPNSSGGHHCTDEWDIMCYSDQPNFPPMRFVCPNESGLNFDCNGDDYFNPIPEPGSYLATHWNTADSDFLIAGPDLPACPDAEYEPDNDHDAPRFVPVGTTERHAFCTRFDFDLVAIRARAGVAYRFETRNLAPGVNTGITIYRKDEYFNTYVAFDDNGNGGLASRINYTPPIDSILLVVTEERNINHGPDMTYDLRIIRPVDDTIPPISAAEISPEPRAVGWNQGPVTVELSATDNERGAGVHALTWSASGAQTIAPTTVYQETAALIIDQPGNTTVSYFSTDQNFNQETPQTITINIDSEAPTATDLRAVLATSYQAVGSRVPLHVAWTGADTGGSGIARFALQRSSDGGATWIAMPLDDPTATGAVALVPAGQHMFRVRSIDRAGNVGQWVAGRSLTVETLQEYSAAVALTGEWTRARSPGAFGGWVTSTGTSGASASLSFKGRSVAWVAATVPAHRIAEIWLDGVLVDTIDLFSVNPQPARVVWTRSFATTVKRVVTIRLKYGTSEPTALLIVDGFIVTR